MQCAFYNLHWGNIKCIDNAIFFQRYQLFLPFSCNGPISMGLHNRLILATTTNIISLRKVVHRQSIITLFINHYSHCSTFTMYHGSLHGNIKEVKFSNEHFPKLCLILLEIANAMHIPHFVSTTCIKCLCLRKGYLHRKTGKNPDNHIL